MTQGGYQVIIAVIEAVLFAISPPSFKVRGLQMAINLALV